uniref:Integrase core domain containing protein n=1 Tax=Solanum tuberosum TaxID=4113 RepID=M1D9Y1_SOLTU
MTYIGDPRLIVLSMDRRYHGTKKALVYSRRGKSKSVAPSHRLLNRSSGEEYSLRQTRGFPTAPVITRCRNRQVVVFYEEHPSFTTPVVAPTLKRPLSILRSRISAQVPAAHRPLPLMPLALKRLMTHQAFLCSMFRCPPSQTCGSLHTVRAIEKLLKWHKCDWMARSPGKFSEEMTRDLYASYAATVRNAMREWAKPLAQSLLQATLVWNFFVDISETTIRCFIYGPTHTLPINIAEYDYRMGVVQSGAFQMDVEQR